MKQSLTPIEYYETQVNLGAIQADDTQLVALNELQSIHAHLIKEHHKRNHLFGKLRTPKLVKGLYLWGGVGIGKTFLMDCFYNCIPFSQKKRMHFHAFMQLVQQKLKHYQGKKNPLARVAKEFSKQAMLFCFDEFFVSDIADAMILSRLFEALFAEGVCLVTTSNIAPDDLYKGGLQRPLFLPTIALLKKNTTVLHAMTATDYRLRHLKNAGVFHTPNSLETEKKLTAIFDLLAQQSPTSEASIELFGRTIPIKKQTDNMIWFDFNVICNIPRSHHDYLAIAETYHTVFISNVPIIPAEANNQIHLFIRLVDVFYDARVRLVLSAADSIDNLYTQGRLLFDYGRTKSRLLEMQSESYFSTII